MYRITVEIDGMNCKMCEAHVNELIRNAFLVKKVKSSAKKGITEIMSEDEISEDDLRFILDPSGYRVVSVK